MQIWSNSQIDELVQIQVDSISNLMVLVEIFSLYLTIWWVIGAVNTQKVVFIHQKLLFGDELDPEVILLDFLWLFFSSATEEIVDGREKSSHLLLFYWLFK